MGNNVIPINLTLTQEQIDLLDHVAENLGTANRSAAARFILTDWPKLKLAAIRAAIPVGECSPQAGCDCPPAEEE